MDVEEKLEALAEKVEKVEQENQYLKERNEKLENKVESLHFKLDKATGARQSQDKDDEEISRRSFLRKLGAGAVGLGALSLAPAASKLTITDTGIEGSTGLNFLDSGSQYFKVNSGGPVEVQNTDFRIPTGNAIEDGGGVNRFDIISDRTNVNDDGGNKAIQLKSGGTYDYYARSSEPWRIYDLEGTFPAVQYDTDTSSGVLRTPGAGIFVENNGTTSSGEGLQLSWATDGGFITAYDHDAAAFQPINFKASIYDFSREAANLRLATGQAIEDGNGNDRLKIRSADTIIRDDAENLAAQYISGSEFRHFAGASEPWVVRDGEGSFTAVQYTTSSSAPGMLKLDNSALNMAHHELYNVGANGVNGNGIDIISHQTSDPGASSNSIWVECKDGNNNTFYIRGYT